MCYLCDEAIHEVSSADEIPDYWDPAVTPITAAELANAVRRVAQQEPDKIYERPVGSGCRYTHEVEETRAPGCIIGQAVFSLTGQVVHQESMKGSVSTGIWADTLSLNEDRMNGYLKNWLREVQANQDAGFTWSEAVRSADNNIRFR
jgi:hypothetical protein